MKIVSVGEGLFPDAAYVVRDKPCILLVADEPEEIMALMQTLSVLDDVTVIRRASPAPSIAEETK